MGRPPKPLGQVRADLVKLCVTRTEKATLKAAAKRVGMDVSTWLRGVGLREAASLPL